jgi:hypothetical protein
VRRLAFDIVTIIVIVATLAVGFALAPQVRARQTEKQIEYGMLNEWRKEIVRLQYTDFCASVKLPSPAMMQVLKQVIAQGKEAKHPVADEMEAFFSGLAEQYAAKGCGDA